jgi:ribonuclease P protein component
MTLLAQPNGRGRDRLGIIASKRLGGAVVRNRAKRRVRDVFRRNQVHAPADALDLVVIPKHELLSAAMPAIEADFVAAVRRIRRLP